MQIPTFFIYFTLAMIKNTLKGAYGVFFYGFHVEYSRK